MKKTSLLLLIIFGSIFFNAAAQNTAKLDMNAYLNAANADQIYPSQKQIEMLKAFIPEKTFQIAPPISDRTFWDKIAASESGKNYYKNALKQFDKQPEVPISDEIYREANKQGNRGMYKSKYYNTMERLENFMLAECMENNGRFIPQIKVYLKAIMDMKSWMHPNHDDAQNSNLEGKSVSIDLGARKFGTVIALSERLFGNKLPDSLRTAISNMVHKRITESYLSSCKGENKRNSWIRGTSNWNSVCTSGSVFSTISTTTDANERLVTIGSALNSMKNYLSGFGQDGYCSEGIGYWSYGFGHYLYLAQILYDYTDGKIDLFEANNPAKLKNVGNFPENFQIQNNFYAPFADGNITAATESGNFPYIMSALKYGAQKPAFYSYEEAVEQLIAWTHPKEFAIVPTAKPAEIKLPNSTYFDDFGMVISRGKEKVPFSIAMKAGHNAENHNHSDVGTYSLLLNNEFVMGDIGAPSYTAGAFSPDNKARSSWGHPVPRIDNILQSNGRQFSGKIIKTDFSDTKDLAVLDIKSAYDIPYLEKLIRTMQNDKTGNGTITVEDQFSTTKPVIFGTAIMTFSKYEIVDAKTIILTSPNQKVKVEITSTGGVVKITPERVPVEHLRNGKDAMRIGLDFTQPTKSGSITVKYTPIF